MFLSRNYYQTLYFLKSLQVLLFLSSSYLVSCFLSVSFKTEIKIPFIEAELYWCQVVKVRRTLRVTVRLILGYSLKWLLEVVAA